MLTRKEVMCEWERLCAYVNVAEEGGLLDADQAQAMRDRYRERADVVLDHYRKAEKVRT